MWSKLLGLKDVGEITGVDWYLRLHWPKIVLLASWSANHRTCWRFQRWRQASIVSKLSIR